MRTKKIVNIQELWLEEFLSADDHCGLCANHGVIDTSNQVLVTAAGHRIKPIKAYCICPNGRAMKKGKAKI